MTKTKYYDLQMDDPQDDYDVEVVNANLKKIDEQIQVSFDTIFDYTDRFKSDSPYTFIEIKVTADSKKIGKKINEVRLWQITGTTMVAYRRNSETVISPGPDYVFEEGDTIVVIGSNNVYEKVYEFLYA